MAILGVLAFILIVSAFANTIGAEPEPCKGHRWHYDKEGNMRCKECNVRADSL